MNGLDLFNNIVDSMQYTAGRRQDQAQRYKTNPARYKMSGILVLLIIAFSVFLQKPSYTFFVGFGGAGGMDNAVKEGIDQGVVAATLAPSNLKVVVVSPIQLNLTWQDNSNDELGFEIERKTVGGEYIEIAAVKANVTSYTDASFNSGTTCYYRIRAYNAVGNSGYSNEATALTPPNNIPSVPSTPSGPDPVNAGVTCTYSTSATDSDGYQIKYGWDWGDGSPIQWSSFGASGWIDSRSHAWPTPGTYSVKAKAQNFYGIESAWSIPKTVTIHGWSKVAIGSNLYGIGRLAVGNGRNDGKIRIYGAAVFNFYEYTWNGSSWGQVEIGSGYSITALTVGNVRNDSVTHVYVNKNDYSYGLYEFTWNGSSWAEANMGPAGNITYDVAIGNGRNDGTIHAYVCNYNGDINEYTYGSTWTISNVGSAMWYMWGVAVGSGRNDGATHVYGASEDNHIYEFLWNGSSWIKTDVGAGGNNMNHVAIGNGRNDGVTRIYGANEDYHLYEFSWNGSSWTKVDMGSGSWYMNSIAIGNGRNDGVTRVYGTNTDDHIYEFSWNGSSWTQVDIGSGGSQMHPVAIGNARNDGVMRVYGGCSNGYVYEFTWH